MFLEQTFGCPRPTFGNNFACQEVKGSILDENSFAHNKTLARESTFLSSNDPLHESPTLGTDLHRHNGCPRPTFGDNFAYEVH